MPKQEGQKSKLLALLRIFETQTDENHLLNVPQLVRLLEQQGILPDAVATAGQARQLLDRLQQRRTDGLTTPKQIRFLEQKGFVHVGTWSFEAARQMIARIAASGWRLPPGVKPSTYKPEG